MIFGRRKKNRDENPADEQVGDEAIAAADDESGAAGEAGAEPGTGGAGSEDSDGSPGEDVEKVLAELDARDWRAAGPYDISEVTLDDDEQGSRIDLGGMIVTGIPGAELRLQVAEETQQIVSAMLIFADSALELGVYAAPRSRGFWPELRGELIEDTISSGGSAALANGPFGVELRRLIPVRTPEGEQGYQPSRMWVVEGPRWLLRGIVYGQSALDEDAVIPQELINAFRSVIVRRGTEAIAPGDPLPLQLPAGLAPVQA